MEVETCRVIGCYVTEKKDAKINWTEFENVCRNRGFSLVKINLTKSLEDQGPFFAIIHKMTGVLANSSLGDVNAAAALENVESYIERHPEVVVVDPLDSVRLLMNRSKYYGIIQNGDLSQDMVFTPTFVNLTSNDINENLRQLEDGGVTFPFVCKPLVSHGSDAHQMAVIFNKEGVADCRPPCVAQSFINHNAVLYKMFCVGDHFYVSERPSLKNFKPSDQKTIFFYTSDVSKADSASSLSVLDPEDAAASRPNKPDAKRLQHIVNTLRLELGLTLFGVDVVIDNESGKYGIIDINVFPSYDGFPNFFESLLDTVVQISSSFNNRVVKKGRRLSDDAADSVSSRKHEKTKHVEESSVKSLQFCPRPRATSGLNTNQSSNQETEQDDSGFDTGDSSDERKKKWQMDRARVGQVRKIAQQIQMVSTSSSSTGSGILEIHSGQGLNSA